MASNAVATMEEPQAGRAVAVRSEARESYAILKDKARMFSMSPLIPDALRAGGPDQAMANCLIALEMANLMGESALVVMQNIHIVKGKAGFSAQYMIARANASGVFKGRINWREKGQGDTLSVTAFATLADTGEEISFTCDMVMAKAEGWTSNLKYRSMGALMLRYRSATFLIRLYAPDVMLGYQTAEEHDDMIAAAGPMAATSPLTGAMLLEQARPQPEPEPADTITAESPNAEEGRTDDQHGDQHDGTDEDHRIAIVEGIIARAAKVEIVADLLALSREFGTHAEALPDDMRARVETALAAAETRINGKGKA